MTREGGAKQQRNRVHTSYRTVAIKVLPEHAAGDPRFRERFEREARPASALNHPSILSVFDVGREGNTDYLVTELVEGVTLRVRVDDGALPAREIVAIGAQIADRLAPLPPASFTAISSPRT